METAISRWTPLTTYHSIQYNNQHPEQTIDNNIFYNALLQRLGKSEGCMLIREIPVMYYVTTDGVPSALPYRFHCFHHSNFAIWNSGPETFSKNKAVRLSLSVSLSRRTKN